jgi:diguanylate cyclase (GGDEF)-like protein/PAS domain S-box-containing protein
MRKSKEIWQSEPELQTANPETTKPPSGHTKMLTKCIVDIVKSILEQENISSILEQENILLNWVNIWEILNKKEISAKIEECIKKSGQKENELKKELVESERKYQLIANHTGDAVTVYDMNLNLTFASPSVLRIKWYTVEEIMGKSLKERVTPKSLDFLHETFKKEMQLEASWTADPKRSIIIELEEYKKDGSIVILESTVSYIRDENQKAIEIVAITRDITERKRIENELNNTKHFLDNIINTLGEPVFVKDSESRFVLVNDALCKMLGMKREEIIGKTLAESLPEYQMNHFLKIDRQVLSTGIENQSEECLQKRTIVTKKTCYIDNQGKKFLLGVIHDITERKRIEKELEKWAEIFKYYKGGVMVIDEDNETLDMMNPEFAKMYWYTIEEIKWTPISNIFAPEVRKNISKYIKRSHKTNHYIFESIHIKKDGSQFPVQINITAVKDDKQKVLYHIFNVQDITRHNKEKGELQRKANIDDLTWLYSPRFIKSNLNRIAKWYDGVVIIMFDLDLFKEINDTYWHDVWDMALKEFAKILKENTRPDDISWRKWWDEFISILIINSSQKEEIEKIAEDRIRKIKEALSKISIKAIDKKGKEKLVWIETSIWYSYRTKLEWESVRPINVVLKEADINMYKEKKRKEKERKRKEKIKNEFKNIIRKKRYL